MKPLHEIVLLGIFAVGARALAAAALGEGAPFGPDGTGVEAAVHLGGHLYPFHVELIRLIGSARALSVISGGLCAPLLWAIGHRLGLGGAGGWLWAAAPLGVYTGALSAGDAPALCLLLVGVLLATGGRRSGLLGGALAMASVAVKPVALPALGLLLLRPWGLVGAALSLPWTSGWLGPLVAPKVQGGLLGSWWVASAGRPPAELAGALSLGRAGLEALMAAPAWTGLLLAPIAGLGALRRGGPGLGVLGPLLGLLGVAALFGDRLEPRYLAASLAALCPYAGALLPGWSGLLGLVPAAAVITQVGAFRASADPLAGVPALPVLASPAVDARALFEESSVAGASAMRLRAAQLAEEAPPGSVIEVEPLPHGREGELLWPLRVARPDLRFVIGGRPAASGPAR